MLKHDEATSSQFHQHFTSSFCADIFRSAKLLQSQTAIIEKLHAQSTFVQKMLMKLTLNLRKYCM
jgi:hypothetical protein